MADTTFELHPRLAADGRLIRDLALSRALLMNDRRFPWVILVPRLPGLRELHDLPPPQRLTLFSEVEAVSGVLLDHFGARKINVGALGNLVPQLHVHVVGRTPEDAAWPGPVWGFGTAEAYPDDDLQARVERLQRLLSLQEGSPDRDLELGG